jgi:hypothetical protein
MAFNKDNSGSLSRNERKEKDTHPDMKGKATINGIEYWISGWTKTNENGKWLSLSFLPKVPPADGEPKGPASAKAYAAAKNGDEIPW